MVRKFTAYVVICDKCYEQTKPRESEESAITLAQELGWININTEHFICTKCNDLSKVKIGEDS